MESPTRMSSSLFLFMLLCFSPFSMANTDPNSIYQSFLQCLPTQLPKPDPDINSIVYSKTANSTAYTTVLETYVKNLRLKRPTTPKPVLVVTPKLETHVQATVLCAKKLGVQIKVRSGGHDYEGSSYTSNEPVFLVMDMSNLRTIDVDVKSETAVLGVGALLGEVYYRIWEKSKTHGFPAGVCPTVGVGGHVGGGGYGMMIRKYGLSTDQVIDAKMVDVNGRVLDRKSMGEDLFWAIRGGGSGSFGVVLSYTVKIVPVPPVNTVFRIMKTVEENAVDLVYRWQEVMKTVDPDLFIRLLLQPSTVNNKQTGRATFIGHFLGDSNRLVALMSKEFPELGLTKENCTEVSWIQAVLYWANFDVQTTKADVLLNRHSDEVRYGKRKSDYVQTPIPKAGLSAIFNKMVELGKVGFVFNPYGGKMNEIAADALPMPHRAGNLFKIQYSVSWNDADLEMQNNYINQSRALHSFMTPYVSKNPRGAFYCYHDLDLGIMTGTGNDETKFNEAQVYGKMYFGQNFDRLVKIKTAVDPDNFFRNEQSIPPLPGKGSGKSR